MLLSGTHEIVGVANAGNSTLSAFARVGRAEARGRGLDDRVVRDARVAALIVTVLAAEALALTAAGSRARRST